MNPQEFVLVPPAKGYGYVEKSTLASAKNGVYHNNFFTKYEQLFQPKDNSSLAIDAFSPNLNKMLHVGHLRQYVTALFLNHFCGYKILCLLGTRLGVIPEAKTKFDTLASKFSSYQVYLDTDWDYEYTFNPHGYHKIFNLRDGEGNYENCLVTENDVVIVKSDGSFTYSFTELFFNLKVNPSFYLTGVEQQDHFKALGLSHKHIPMGLILNEYGQKLKSRDGKSVPFENLLIEIKHNLRENLQSEEIAWNIAVCNLLTANITSNLSFNYKNWTKSDSPGLYITYTYCRLKSLLGKTFYPEVDGINDVIGEVMYMEFQESLATYTNNSSFVLKQLMSLCHKVNKLYDSKKLKEFSDIEKFSISLAYSTIERIMKKLSMNLVDKI